MAGRRLRAQWFKHRQASYAAEQERRRDEIVLRARRLLLASHIALEEAGANYEAVKVDFASGEQRKPEYLAINPKGRVPALVTDRGVLTENPVILGYVAETYKDAKLAPTDDSFAFGSMQAFNLFIGSTLHPAFAHVFRASRYADGEEAQAAVRAKALEAIGEYFALIEERLSDGRTWVHGDDYTVSDPYLFVMTRWTHRDGQATRTGFRLRRNTCSAWTPDPLSGGLWSGKAHRQSSPVDPPVKLDGGCDVAAPRPPSPKGCP